MEIEPSSFLSALGRSGWAIKEQITMNCEMLMQMLMKIIAVGVAF